MESLSTKEHFFIGTFALGVFLLTLFDVLEDWSEGSSLGHIIPEIFIAVSAVCLAVYLFLLFAREKNQTLEEGRRDLERVKKEAMVWKEQASALKSGITDAISEQLVTWGLTPAEQDVAFLLLKGLSLKEVAQVRDTSERTIRQQATMIYRKSGLSGRSQLSAFFLEDLFDS